MFNILTRYIKKQRLEDVPQEPILVPIEKKRQKGWDNIELANRKRQVERDRREFGL